MGYESKAAVSPYLRKEVNHHAATISYAVLASARVLIFTAQPLVACRKLVSFYGQEYHAIPGGIPTVLRDTHPSNRDHNVAPFFSIRIRETRLKQKQTETTLKVMENHHITKLACANH